MPQSLNVIALISGGKDSIYSILHCLQNGHKVVALGNVYPSPADCSQSQESLATQEVEADEDNLNSHMYQTVGHTVIPLYEQALGIRLYRQPIVGHASVMEAAYEQPANGVDETESLVPLLQRIMAAHPDADAVSTGAILSTYQRTRVESVALRLGLVPLSFLWQYPHLPPVSKISLLADMASVGLDARIIKTASWALNESFLWQNVASGDVMRKIEKAMMRFGNEDGAALGEGGEFETLALDGPDRLFKGRIVVDDEDLRVIHGSADTAWMRINRARVEMKTGGEKVHDLSVRIPDVLSDHFQKVCQTLDMLAESGITSPTQHQTTDKFSQWHSRRISLKSTVEGQKWTIVGLVRPNNSIEEEVEHIMAQIKEALDEKCMDVAEIISTLILLRSMSHFASVNKIYGSFFTKPNPPARVTVACGDVLPPGCNIVIQLNMSSQKCQRRSIDDLHVQSRSYWAPANIGPYSQARSDVVEQSTGTTSFVHVAGQIPLIPSTMALPDVEFGTSAEVDMMVDLENPHSELNSHQFSKFIRQAVLSLQHLWRIGQAMDVCWWTGAVAYLSKDTSSNIFRKARLAGEAWSEANGSRWPEWAESNDSEGLDEDERDPWEERYHDAFTHREAVKRPLKKLPDWSVVTPDPLILGKSQDFRAKEVPAFFAAEIEELPRGSDIEWHALLGVTRGPIRQTLSQKRYPIGRAVRLVVADDFSQTVVSIRHAEQVRDLDAAIEGILSGFEDPAEAERRRTSPGYHHAQATFLDAGVAGLWGAESYAGVVPCRSLWRADGSTLERLAAVLVFQCFRGARGERERQRERERQGEREREMGEGDDVKRR